MKKKKYYLHNFVKKGLKLLLVKFSLPLKQVRYLLDICPLLISKVKINKYDINLFVQNASDCYLLLYILVMHTNTLYSMLVDIVVVDYPTKKFRFEINYILLSVDYNSRITITVETDEIHPLVSVWDLYYSAL